MLTVSDYLVDYEKIIKDDMPDFKLVGRDGAIDDLSHILVQQDSANVLMFGDTGVGMSSIAMGLTSRKTDAEKPLPLDIASRRFTWLDVNKLFSLGDEAAITETFQGIIDSLSKSHNRVLVIDDFRDFLDGVESMPNKKLLNMMMGALKKEQFQTMWICRREHLGDVLKCHSDVREVFTPCEIKEPAKDEILEIVKGRVGKLESHHRIKIDPKAATEAVNLLTQYRGAMTFRAQPFRTIHLLDKAAGNKQLAVRNKAPGVEAMEKQVGLIERELANPAAADRNVLEQRKEALLTDIAEKNTEWSAHRDEIRSLIHTISESEESLDKKRHELEAELKKAAEKNDQLKDSRPEDAPPAAPVDKIMASIGLDGNFDSSLLTDTAEVKAIRQAILTYEKALPKLNAQFAELSNKFAMDITLTKDDIKKTFSEETGIPLKKLGVDETDKYMNAEKDLGEMVISQDEAISAVSGSLRRAKAGLKKANKPIGSFFFLGPSGVGKTEMAKALATFMHGDQKSLIRIDMSEYKDKSAVGKLIGAAPGLVGYEEGGTLTNAIQRNPYSIVCFDEIEKAHPEIYDVLLQMLDEGRLTDGKGVTADFTNAVIICTSNFGARHFLREDIDFAQASDIVKEALYNGDAHHEQETPFRPEFLNRFSKIISFNRLSMDTVQMIAKKQIGELGKVISTTYPHLSLDIGKEDLAAFVSDHYQDPTKGARVVTDVAIPNKIGDQLANAILKDQRAQMEAQGDSEEEIEPEAKSIRISYTSQDGVSMDVVPAGTGSTIKLGEPSNMNVKPDAASSFGAAAATPA